MNPETARGKEYEEKIPIVTVDGEREVGNVKDNPEVITLTLGGVGRDVGGRHGIVEHFFCPFFLLQSTVLPSSHLLSYRKSTSVRSPSPGATPLVDCFTFRCSWMEYLSDGNSGVVGLSPRWKGYREDVMNIA